MRPTLIVPVALAAAFVGASPAAYAQDDAADVAEPGMGADRSALSAAAESYVHHVLIARPEQAMASATVLLAADVDAADLADAVDAADLTKRMDDAFRRSRGMPEVADAAMQLETKLEAGRRALARKVDRINASVKMLTGPMRGQMMARDRLMAAGEYAVPALLREIVNGRDPGMEAAATRMLVDMRRQAVLPLAMALRSLDPAAQRKVCVILGQLGSAVAVPVLLDVAQGKGVTPDVSEAAIAAVRALGGTDRPAHEAYAEASYAFLTRDPALAAFPSDPVQNAWKWTEFGGLAGENVSTGAFHDVMAMLMARRALELDAADERALACFIAADLRREAAVEAGAKDPLFAGQGRSARFYATAAGAAAMQDVLGIGLDLSDTGLVRAALAALRETAGAAALVGDGSSPVIAALDYADRRVQFEAAFTLASVRPRAPFPGSEQVVPLLAQAVRGGGQTFVGVIARVDEDAQRIAAAVRAMGCTPLTAARDAEEFTAIAARNGGCDLVVIAGNGAQIARALDGVRAMRMGERVPAVMVAQPEDRGAIDRRVDRITAVVGADAGDDGFRAGVQQLMDAAMGGAVDAGDGSRYVADALAALTRIGLSRDGVFQLTAAEAGLLEAMRTQEGPIRVMAAEVLAMVNTKRAQRAVIDAALAASGDEQAMLLNAVAQGARRFGSQATTPQADAIRDLVRTSSGSLADAAAAAYGALGMPSSEAVDLIVKARVPGAKPAAAAEGSESGQMADDDAMDGADADGAMDDAPEAEQEPSDEG